MRDKEFDKILKSKLENLKSNDLKAGWGAFEEKFGDQLSGDIIEGADPSVDMFDDMIKNKLSSLTANKGADWASFESKFGDVLDNEEDFDNTLKNSLNNIRAPFQVSHWEILKLRLERILHIRQSLFTSKSMELIIFMLLLITFVNNINFFTSQDQSNDTILPKTDLASIPVVALEETTTLIAEDKVTADHDSDRAVDQKAAIVSNEVVDQTLNTSTKNTTARSSNIDLAKSVDNINTLEKTGNTSQALNNLVSETTASNVSIQEQLPSANAYKVQKPSVTAPTNTSVSEDHKELLNAPEMLTQHAMLLGSKNEEVGLGMIPRTTDRLPLINKDKNKTKVWFHTVVSSEQNFIESHLWNPQGEANYTTKANGYSAGILLGLEKNRIGITTGFKLGNYNYAPAQDVEETFRDLPDGSTAYIEVNLNDIEHNTISIPLGIDYTILSNDKWKIFASTGLNLNILSTTNYSFDQEIIGTLPPGIPPPIIQGDTIKTVFSEKSFVRGINQGGEFSEAATLYGKVGFGVQRTFGNALALYAQPMYHRQLSARNLGPNGDRINRLAVNFGLKFKFDVRARVDR